MGESPVSVRAQALRQREHAVASEEVHREGRRVALGLFLRAGEAGLRAGPRGEGVDGGREGGADRFPARSQGEGGEGLRCQDHAAHLRDRSQGQCRLQRRARRVHGGEEGRGGRDAALRMQREILTVVYTAAPCPGTAKGVRERVFESHPNPVPPIAGSSFCRSSSCSCSTSRASISGTSGTTSISCRSRITVASGPISFPPRRAPSTGRSRWESISRSWHSSIPGTERWGTSL